MEQLATSASYFTYRLSAETVQPLFEPLFCGINGEETADDAKLGFS